ncbi:group II truncated hemoglobin [Novosphingobium mangrovi (ex Hu et al. 2023)]|uniref:Group II truncated hemoglobin n=1 Tax=Novosphingobium mangrovi (ex Hu et al. 2023) TaxID=2930094 RepID=A0ABT0AGX6_9SPHN|nr:group II truncated hemoglobin [Novosphingobium mangrovi (ex Hu et al. 2023)]MCJ1962434.1 group II truncated hemoglobin [Novosphingobium mangrovi (ex Hu et al. 2023)]
MSEETAGQEQPIIERVGGKAVIDRLVVRFYERMDTLEEAQPLRALHPADLGHTTLMLQNYLTEWLGGPPLYSSEKGHPRMRMRHMKVPIGNSARDQWMLCMNGALDECIADPPAREAIRNAMAKLADWMRNTEDTPA